MSESLIKRLREQRKLKVVVGRFTFVVSRPTDVEMIELVASGAEPAEFAHRFVTDWSGVIEDDIIGGGGSDAVPFNADLWAEWWADRPDFWAPVSTALIEAYKAHTATIDAVSKK